MQNLRGMRVGKRLLHIIYAAVFLAAIFAGYASAEDNAYALMAPTIEYAEIGQSMELEPAVLMDIAIPEAMTALHETLIWQQQPGISMEIQAHYPDGWTALQASSGIDAGGVTAILHQDDILLPGAQAFELELRARLYTGHSQSAWSNIYNISIGVRTPESAPAGISGRALGYIIAGISVAAMYLTARLLTAAQQKRRRVVYDTILRGDPKPKR